MVEVVFDGALATTRNDDDLIAAGGERFFDSILNDRLVHQRQHLLWHCLGGGQESCAEACGRKDGFAYFHLHGTKSDADGAGYVSLQKNQNLRRRSKLPAASCQLALIGSWESAGIDFREGTAPW